MITIQLNLPDNGDDPNNRYDCDDCAYCPEPNEPILLNITNADEVTNKYCLECATRRIELGQFQVTKHDYHPTITNEDGHTINDLAPMTPIHNLAGYLDEAELLHVLDLYDEETVLALDKIYGDIETLCIDLHTITPNAYMTNQFALQTIFANARDLLHD
jgi:hypothetical protein